jgi:hypothetical protein
MIKFKDRAQSFKYSSIEVGDLVTPTNSESPLLCCFDDDKQDKFLINLESFTKVIGPEYMQYHYLKITQEMEVEYH